jgi:hypothetical protein
MKTYDLAVAWNWEFDADFVSGIRRECESRGLTMVEVQPADLPTMLEHLRSNTVSIGVFYDRASDADEAFNPLVDLTRHGPTRTINPHDRVRHAIDKATMHLEFITNGLHVPYTTILSPFNQKKEIELVSTQLDKLGKPFVIKPANTTGGGTGVVLDAMTVNDIFEARQQHKDDKYLLQEKIDPKNLDGKRGWFRVYYAFGEIIPCWWDDLTHMYSELTSEEEARFGLSGLRDVVSKIENICRLDFFSSEIAQTNGGTFVVVDYVNEICDMRLQSRYHNGAPDAVVQRIQQLVAGDVERHARRHGAITAAVEVKV